MKRHVNCALQSSPARPGSAPVGGWNAGDDESNAVHDSGTRRRPHAGDTDQTRVMRTPSEVHNIQSPTCSSSTSSFSWPLPPFLPFSADHEWSVRIM